METKPMNIEKAYYFIKLLSRAAMQLSLGVFFLILAPAAIIALTVSDQVMLDKEQSMMTGVICIFVFAIFSMVFMINGLTNLLRFIRLKKEGIAAFKDGAEYINAKKIKWTKSLIPSITVCIILLILGAFPITSISIMGSTNVNYQLFSLTAVFILSGCGLFILLLPLTKFLAIRRINVETVSHTENEDVIDKRAIKRRGIISIIIFWAAAAVIFSCLVFITGEINSQLILLPIAAVLFVLWLFVANPFNRLVQIKKRQKSRRILRIVSVIGTIAALIWFMGIGTWYIQPYISLTPNIGVRQIDIDYDRISGVYTIKMPDKSDFKILQLTDIHLGGSFITKDKDTNALDSVYTLIKSTSPDFIIVTGDLVYPVPLQTFSYNNYIPVLQFCSFMRNIGIPWAFAYGNHDTEVFATHTDEEMNKLFDGFSYKNTQSLLYNSVQPDISGRNNQLIKVVNSDGSINQALFILDSNSYADKKINTYDYIHDDQVDWYEENILQLNKENGKTVSSLLFFHIPIQEYKTAYDLYKSGSGEATYFYGKIGEADEAISCSQYHSKLFDKAVELGSTKGIFVGHDHYNTLSIEYKNIRLTYGMSIDYLAMPGIAEKTEQRGATLITLHPDSSFDVEPIKLTDVQKKD